MSFTVVLRLVGRLSLAGLMVSTLVLLTPLDASATKTEDRLMFGRACDSGPELGAWFSDRDGTSPLPLGHLGELIGARVSPAESISGMGALVAAATPGSGLTVFDLTRPGSSTDVAGIPPPTPFGSFANLAWSPDGDLVAYVAEDDSGPAIWIHDLGNGPPEVRLVDLDHGDLVTGVDWSPDGASIIWSERSFEEAQGEVFTVGIESKMADSLGAGDSPRYSPDGGKVAFILNGKVGTMSPDGTAVVLTSYSGATPVWSPSGAEIGFVELAGSSRHITILDIGTNEVKRVFSSTAACDDVLSMWDWALTQVPSFEDVPYDHLFSSDIEWLADEGITKGCGSSRFCPDLPVSRDQLAAFLVRAMGYIDAGGGDLFVDDDNSIFEHDIDKLGTAGVTRGCNPPVNDRFCPDGLVTRAQMAAFLVRALGLTDDGGGDLFTDDDHSIFEGDIDKLRSAGITKGCNPPVNDRFCPDDVVTRAQIAAFLRRALG